MTDVIDRFIDLDARRPVLVAERDRLAKIEADLIARMDEHWFEGRNNRPSFAEIRAARTAADAARRALMAVADEIKSIRQTTPDLDRLVSNRINGKAH